MEKDELKALVTAKNRELREANDRRQEAETLRQKTRERLSETHRIASGLATRLLDQHEAGINTVDLSRGRKAYSRRTPDIPLGEVDASDPAGRTDGYARVSVRLSAEQTFKTGRRFPLVGTVYYDYDEVTSSKPSEDVYHVDVVFFVGRPDGTDLLHNQTLSTGAVYSYPHDPEKAVPVLTELLAEGEKTVEVLECLLADSTQSPVAS